VVNFRQLDSCLLPWVRHDLCLCLCFCSRGHLSPRRNELC
jgi:hypothetical protein